MHSQLTHQTDATLATKHIGVLVVSIQSLVTDIVKCTTILRSVLYTINNLKNA